MLRCLLCTALLLAAVSAHAQEPGFFSLTGHHLRGPFTPSGATFLGLGVGVAVLSEDMESPHQEVGFMEWAPLESASEVGTLYGDGKFALALAASAWAAGALSGNDRTAAFGRDLAATFVATGAWVWVLKSTIGARRPDGGPYSFPSGHTAVAFATATTLHRHFGRLAGFLGYTVATMTAAARMEDRRHFFRDVSFGATLGMAVAGAHVPISRWLPGVGVSPGGVTYEVRF